MHFEREPAACVCTGTTKSSPLRRKEKEGPAPPGIDATPGRRSQGITGTLAGDQSEQRIPSFALPQTYAGPAPRCRIPARGSGGRCAAQIAGTAWGPAPAESRRRLLPPKPCSGVYFGGAFSRFSPPWLAGAPPPAPAGGATATIPTSKTRLRCLFRRCFFLVRAPVASRRPPPGASGPPLSWVFALRGARTGVPHANWATWLSDVP